MFVVIHSVSMAAIPKVSVRPSNFSLSSGSSASFQCVTIGKPSPHLSWRFKDQPVGADLRGMTVSGNILHLKNVTRAHIGVYTCTAENSVGSSAAHASVLDVIGKTCR